MTTKRSYEIVGVCEFVLSRRSAQTGQFESIGAFQDYGVMQEWLREEQDKRTWEALINAATFIPNPPTSLSDHESTATLLLHEEYRIEATWRYERVYDVPIEGG